MAKRPHRNTCCSRECGFALDRVRKATAKAARSAEILEATATLAALLPHVRHRCDECDAAEVAFAGRLCSDACRRARAGRKAHAREVAKIEARPVWRGQCAQCGGEFWVKKHRGKKFCGAECSRAFFKLKRAALLRGAQWKEHVPMRGLVRRDKGICHLCDEAVRTDLGILHDLAPTRDHLVPVTHGGEHSWANIKLAHRICNSRRRERSLEEWFRERQKADADAA
jgi:5-methylcytosine-specific restriction endonuclease McrA